MAHWFHEILNAKRIEPQKRKHGSLKPEWIHHRFPIKDGISLRQAMVRDFVEMKNPLFERINRGATQ